MPQRKFRIMLARTAGFCMGVRRALRMVLNAADEPSRPVPIKTIGLWLTLGIACYLIMVRRKYAPKISS